MADCDCSGQLAALEAKIEELRKKLDELDKREQKHHDSQQLEIARLWRAIEEINHELGYLPTRPVP